GVGVTSPRKLAKSSAEPSAPLLARPIEYDALACALSAGVVLAGLPSDSDSGPMVVARDALSTEASRLTPMLESLRICSAAASAGPLPGRSGTTRPTLTSPETPSDTEPLPCTPASFWSPIGRLKSNCTGAPVW